MLLLFSPDQAGPEWLEPRGHRAIGVVYRPEFEHLGNYVPTVMPRRYDALIYLDNTCACGRSTTFVSGRPARCPKHTPRASEVGHALA